MTSAEDRQQRAELSARIGRPSPAGTDHALPVEVDPSGCLRRCLVSDLQAGDVLLPTNRLVLASPMQGVKVPSRKLAVHLYGKRGEHTAVWNARTRVTIARLDNRDTVKP